jgi:hypothetical protein
MPYSETSDGILLLIVSFLYFEEVSNMEGKEMKIG